MPRMPGAEWRPLPVNHTKGGNRPRVQITHIIVGTLMGADSWFRNPDARVSSHFGVGRDGRVLQWVDTADTAWANRSANSYSVSVENEGTTGDALTAAQLQANARILEWAGRTHSIALRVNDSVSGSGLSYHSMDPSWGVTACPGSRIIAQRAEIVRRAQALRGGSPTPPEDDMPRRTLYGTTDYERRVPPGQWTSLNFNRRHDGSRWTEKEAEPSFVFGPCYYSASVAVRVKGLQRGQEFQIRVAHFRQLADGGYENVGGMPIHSPVHDGGSGHFVYTWNGFISASRKGRVRAQVMHHGKDPVTVDYARAESLYWPA
ncbi:hypothetical protein GCM10009716_09460 [Streptomyces sodiiphilus]|uniref:N-acetylmuramoyl-L-alanine amidase n=2 Tax=Streptomyces sodiiphilus TaxID=226217 RepID=A0ABP5A4R2_9ACTN